MAILRRVSDGKGDQGSNVEAIRFNEEGKVEHKQTNKPLVGWALRVGSVTARSYSNQDWWMTTVVTEILEEKESEEGLYIKFKTGNSLYEFWS
jgi:hypothetical protein